MQAISTGLPAYLSYLAAKEDAKKEGPQDPSKYMSAVDTMYGGQFERPPEERRIQNLLPTYKAAGGMMGQQPVNGLKAMEPIQYSAATGQGVMGLAKGGAIDIKELETLMEEKPGEEIDLLEATIYKKDEDSEEEDIIVTPEIEERIKWENDLDDEGERIKKKTEEPKIIIKEVPVEKIIEKEVVKEIPLKIPKHLKNTIDEAMKHARRRGENISWYNNRLFEN